MARAKTKQINVRVDAELREALMKKADREDVFLSDVTIALWKAWLTDEISVRVEVSQKPKK